MNDRPRQLSFADEIDGAIQRAALLSSCGRYRYWLQRKWGENGKRAGFVMLNPSTADATVDDPTIRKCIAFASQWGCQELNVVNLFAFRATDPRELRKAQDPIGWENDRMILEALEGCNPIVAAWGTGRACRLFARPFKPLDRKDRDIQVAAMIESKFGAGALQCLRLCENGMPGHPLYLRVNEKLQPFRVRGWTA